MPTNRTEQVANKTVLSEERASRRAQMVALSESTTVPGKSLVRKEAFRVLMSVSDSSDRLCVGLLEILERTSELSLSVIDVVREAEVNAEQLAERAHAVDPDLAFIL